MPDLAVNGGTVHYEDIGRGVPVVLTPGGRWGGHVHRVVAAALAEDCRVITWDRRNSDGRSSVVIAGEMSEADLWADDLAALIEALGLGPCYLGEYAGCRTTPLLCLKHPHLVKGLMLAWPSGGEVPAARLPRNFYQAYTRAALRAGMEGVVETGAFADSIRLNPANREALLAMDPIRFVRQMAFWESFFNTSADLPVAGCRASAEEWASIAAPASITGGIDPVHPPAAAETLHRLLRRSRLHPPVVTEAEWERVFDHYPYPVTSDFQGERIAPLWRDFIREMEG